VAEIAARFILDRLIRTASKKTRESCYCFQLRNFLLHPRRDKMIEQKSETANPTIERTTLDPARQQQARIYARLQRRLSLVDLAIGLVYLISWLVFGWSLSLKTWLVSFTTNDWLLVALYAIIFGGIFAMINLPLSYYESFMLPHRFGLSTQNLHGWIVDLIKAGTIGGILALLLLEIIYAVLRAFPDTWWLWAACIMLFFNVILASLASVLLFPLFYKLQPLGEEFIALEKRLVQLAENARTRVSGVYKFDLSQRTKAANAALVGLGNTRRIILGDTLLNEFSTEEIEVVMAHELGHQVHRDIPKGIIIQSVITLVGFYFASIGLEKGASALGFEGPADIAALPLLMLIFGVYGLITMPLTNAYLRWRERQADRFALQTTGNGAAFASAMTRLANQNLAQVNPPGWEEFLFHSHPALDKRIAMAQGFQKPAESI
jgi:STE24 endopeptidase